MHERELPVHMTALCVDLNQSRVLESTSPGYPTDDGKYYIEHELGEDHPLSDVSNLVGGSILWKDDDADPDKPLVELIVCETDLTNIVREGTQNTAEFLRNECLDMDALWGKIVEEVFATQQA